jgi:Arc/MetJ-type ribon-helix-helix transcriptional regulator
MYHCSLIAVEQKKEGVIINLQIPQSLRDLIDEIVKKDTHGTLSEFVREAIREKIWREHPELIKNLVTDNR